MIEKKLKMIITRNTGHFNREVGKFVEGIQFVHTDCPEWTKSIIFFCYHTK